MQTAKSLIVAVFALALSAGQAICACPSDLAAAPDTAAAMAHEAHAAMDEHCAEPAEQPVHQHAPDGQCGHGGASVSAPPAPVIKASLGDVSPIVFTPLAFTPDRGIPFAARDASWRPPPDGPPRASPVDLKIRQLI